MTTIDSNTPDNGEGDGITQTPEMSAGPLSILDDAADDAGGDALTLEGSREHASAEALLWPLTPGRKRGL